MAGKTKPPPSPRQFTLMLNCPSLNILQRMFSEAESIDDLDAQQHVVDVRIQTNEARRRTGFAPGERDAGAAELYREKYSANGRPG